MPVLCGMDIATRSGIAIMDGDRLLHTEAFRPKGKADAEIFHGFRAWLRPLLVSFAVEHVAIEEPLRSDLSRTEKDGTKVPISNMQTFLRIYGLRALAVEMCFALNIDCCEINQSTWRKAFLGNGRADKDMAVAQCKLLGYAVTSKDASEAIGVCWWLAGHLKTTQLYRPGELFAQQGAA